MVGKALQHIALFLLYQTALLKAVYAHSVVIFEKSRRIGASWAMAAIAVLHAAASKGDGGMNVYYMGYNQDMARDFITACAFWAKLFNMAAADFDEVVIKDEDKDILAFRIIFPNGQEILALPSAARVLRGKQGMVILDEAAFHDDLSEVLKAALALLMWGGKVVIISTHDGDANQFNQLVEDVRASRKPFHLLRTTFDDALSDGLFKRICETKGKEWTLEAEADWRQEIENFYGDGANEELHCIPAQGSGTALSTALIEARMEPDIPVLTWKPPKGFVDWPEHLRVAEARDWCEANLKEPLSTLDPNLTSGFGEDFGRLRDGTVIWPFQIQKNLKRRPPFVVELLDVPFEQQKQVLFYIVDRLPRFLAGALDATGIGFYLAEVCRQRYGAERIAEIKLSVEWYRENMPRFIAAFEDATTVMPRDADLLNDHRILRKVNGVIQVPALRVQDTKDKTRKRHGDSAIAHALAIFASNMDVAPVDFISSGERPVSAGAFGAELGGGGGQQITDTGFGSVRSDTNWSGY